MAFSIGQTVGDYQIIQILGAGGMGTVYKVRHLISDRLEAMKLVLPELTQQTELADRFMREIKVQARLSHPHIASLHNALRIGDQLLMIMELVEGATLHNYMRPGALAPGVAIDIALQILQALEYAHSQGVIHRDIKPANIMLTSAHQVKLMDFGIARSLAEESPLTQTGAAVGSVYYMSPEQVQGTAIDARADLYSVGVLLYEMVTGVRPVTGESSWVVMNAHVHLVPRSPSSLNSKLPETLSLAILKALEKSPANRFQSAQAFHESLLAVRARLAASPAAYVPPPPKLAYDQTELATPVQTTPTPSVAVATPPSATAQVTARFEPEKLEKLTRELASFVGPMAKLLVSRAARKAQTWKQLYDALAPEVPEGAERKQFLSHRP